MCNEYRYLGILLNDTGDVKSLTEEYAKKQKQFKRLVAMNWSRNLPASDRCHIWNTFVESKFTYARSLITMHFPKLRSQTRSFLYNAARALLNIKKNLQKDKLLQIMFGDVEKYIENQELKCRHQIDQKPLPEVNKMELKSAKERFKTIVMSNAKELIQWSCGLFMNGRTREKTTRCICNTQLSDTHWQNCEALKEYAGKYGKLDMEEMMKRLREVQHLLLSPTTLPDTIIHKMQAANSKL